jgi:hypothetical protein
MPAMVQHTAGEILAMSREELKKLRPTFFSYLRSRERTKELNDAFMEFIVRYTRVQDMRDWSCLAEPGIAAFMIDDDEVSDEDMESAREIDRNSLEMHGEAVTEFEESGGKDALQKAIDRLNSLC